MELTLSTHLLVYAALDAAALRALAASGYATVEVWLAEPHVPWRDAHALEEFGGRLRDHGLRAGTVHLPFYPSVPALRAENRRWSVIDPASAAARREAVAGAAAGLQAAAALGARAGVLHLGWQGDVWSESSHAWAREAVAELLPVARHCGVQLLLENIISEGTRAARLVELLDELDPVGDAGVCLDLGHAHVEGDVLDQLEAALPRLAHLHVHDNDGASDDHRAPGAGTLPWRAVLGRLRAHDYRGQGALEIRDSSKGRETAATVVAREAGLARAFEHTWAARDLLPQPSGAR
ncbi:MAG TPA: sugar phosphate isomerase/epimerase family protein [Planctomycetota bacterium]